MSVASPPAGAASDTSLPPVEGCPLCGAPLPPAQDWCLNCGAAARTRLAAAPGWRAPLIGLGLVIVLALGALTAALVTLAGAPPSSTPVTRTVTTPAAAVAPTSTAPTGVIPTNTAPTNSTSSLSSPTSTTTATATATSTVTTSATTPPAGGKPSTTLPGANVPGDLGSSKPNQ